MPSSPEPSPSLPRWLWAGWLLALPGTTFLALRLLYEMTILTWRDGPQMVGFSLVHGGGMLVLWSTASAFLMLLWLLVAAVLCVTRASRRRTIGGRAWWALAVSAALLAVIVGAPAVSG